MSTEAAALLRESATLIRSVGLHRAGGLWPGHSSLARTFVKYTPGDPVCAIGALAVVAERQDAPMAARTEAMAALDGEIGRRRYVHPLSDGARVGVASWSDLIATGPEDIAATFELVATQIQEGQT